MTPNPSFNSHNQQSFPFISRPFNIIYFASLHNTIFMDNMSPETFPFSMPVQCITRKKKRTKMTKKSEETKMETHFEYYLRICTKLNGFESLKAK